MAKEGEKDKGVIIVDLYRSTFAETPMRSGIVFRSSPGQTAMAAAVEYKKAQVSKGRVVRARIPEKSRDVRYVKAMEEKNWG